MSGKAALGEGRGQARVCPVCGKPAVGEAKPFCSRRCADVDLGRWLKGVYAIPARPDPSEDEGEEDAAPGEGEQARAPGRSAKR